MAVTEPGVTTRRARPGEAVALTELIMRSKAHWGYDQAFLDACRPVLALSPEVIQRDPVYCAEVAGRVAGVSHLIMLNDAEVDLDHLFVDPEFIGQGVGAQLWRHAVDRASALGARAIVFGADPNARPFYERMGAVVVSEQVSTIVAGRRTPQMRYEIPDPTFRTNPC
jgi:GNAT superfamily N-acetyltransferase